MKETAPHYHCLLKRQREATILSNHSLLHISDSYGHLILSGAESGAGFGLCCELYFIFRALIGTRRGGEVARVAMAAAQALGLPASIAAVAI